MILLKLARAFHLAHMMPLGLQVHCFADSFSICYKLHFLYCQLKILNNMQMEYQQDLRFDSQFNCKELYLLDEIFFFSFFLIGKTES